MLRLAMATAAAVIVGAAAATAHTVTIGWTDNGDGTVTLWNEHWHLDQSFPCSEGILCSANGGLTISGDGTAGSYGHNPYTVQWAGTLNNTDRDDMIADGTLLGYQDDPAAAGAGHMTTGSTPRRSSSATASGPSSPAPPAASIP